MPLDMAVEEPDTGVVGAEAEDDVAVRVYHEGVATHGDGGKGLVHDVVAGVRGRADDGLEVVAVQVEGVFAWVVVVEDDFDGLVFGEDEGVGVGAVDVGDVCGCGGCEGGVEGWDFGGDVGGIVEEGTGGVC